MEKNGSFQYSCFPFVNCCEDVYTIYIYIYIYIRILKTLFVLREACILYGQLNIKLLYYIIFYSQRIEQMCCPLGTYN